MIKCSRKLRKVLMDRGILAPYSGIDLRLEYGIYIDILNGALSDIVSIESIDHLCQCLECQPGDIMEFISDDEEQESYVSRYRKKFPESILIGTRSLLFGSEAELRSGEVIIELDPWKTSTYEVFIESMSDFVLKMYDGETDYVDLPILAHYSSLYDITNIDLDKEMRWCYDQLTN